MNLLSLHNEIKEIADSDFYRFGAYGDNRMMAALCLFMSLSQQLDYGNYCYTKADHLEKNADLDFKSKELLQLLFIQQSLLHYSACFDTILQIIYFSTHLANDFKSEEDFTNELPKVERNTFKSKLKSLEPNLAVSLHNILELYYDKKRVSISNLINSIKHRGGISTESLNTYIPDVANCSGVNIHKDETGKVIVEQSGDFNIVRANWFYPITKSINEYLSILEVGNHDIVDFAKSIHNCLGIDKLISESNIDTGNE